MSTIFDLRITVTAWNILMFLGHVNNVMYIQWMQIAAAHIEKLGFRSSSIFRTQTCNGGGRASCSISESST